MKILSIDLETYSDIDLKESGVYAYAESPAFEILLLGYAVDGGDVKVLDLTQRNIRTPEPLLNALTDPNVLKTAYNANFERTCLAKYFGLEMPPEQWEDTMILAAELGLPRTLAEVGSTIGLAEDQQKMKEGKALIQYFCKPCKPTKTNGQRTRNYPEDAPEKWETFIEYNRRDVETEMAIRDKLLNFYHDPREKELWAIDQRINDRGVMLDRVFAENASKLDDEIKEDLKRRVKMLTGLDNPNSPVQVKAWIKEQTGAEVKSLDKRAISEVKEQIADNKKVLQYLTYRKELGKTSTAKYKAMLSCVCQDNRIRGLSQFYGANRTGRWSGRLVQMQNLPQNKMSDEDLDLARQLVKSGSRESLEMLYEPANALSQLIRTSFIPKPGHTFIVADFSAIEARVLAWLADELWRQKVFADGGDIYCASASKMFGVPVVKHGINGHLRQKGKVAELALGYGGSVGALVAMGALEMGLEEDELKPLVDSWRTSNPHVTNLWWDTDEAAKLVLRTKRRQDLPHGVYIRAENPILRIGLPSGRELSYVRPKLDKGQFGTQITYEGIGQQSSGWCRLETYGPKLVENIVQAISRDCLAETMRRLDQRGIDVVFHVHDEVICEVPEGKYTVEEISDIMGQPIEWAPGLLLRADGYQCEYYRKD